MHLKTIVLKDFRLFRETALHFSDGVNLIVGANGQGKTSLLEAIYLLVSGRSFRTVGRRELVREGADHFVVEAHFIKQGVEQRLSFFSDGKDKRVLHNGAPCRSLVSMLGLMPAVVMTPDDSVLIKGGPQGRRRLLDLHLAQVDPLYVHHMMRYTGAMRQRNFLLRKADDAAIEVWEQQMAISGSYIIKVRKEAVEELSKLAEENYSFIAEDVGTLALNYRTKGADEEQYAYARAKEREVGYTLVGPHRDELLVTLDGKAAKSFASEGQQRSCIAALRLAEWQRLKSIVGEPPLMMIDDLGVSLDAARRQKLLELTGSLGQVFLTAVDDLFESASCIRLHHGAVFTGQ